MIIIDAQKNTPSMFLAAEVFNAFALIVTNHKFHSTAGYSFHSNALIKRSPPLPLALPSIIFLLCSTIIAFADDRDRPRLKIPPLSGSRLVMVYFGASTWQRNYLYAVWTILTRYFLVNFSVGSGSKTHAIFRTTDPTNSS